MDENRDLMINDGELANQRLYNKGRKRFRCSRLRLAAIHTAYVKTLKNWHFLSCANMFQLRVPWQVQGIRDVKYVTRAGFREGSEHVGRCGRFKQGPQGCFFGRRQAHHFRILNDAKSSSRPICECNFYAPGIFGHRFVWQVQDCLCCTWSWRSIPDTWVSKSLNVVERRKHVSCQHVIFEGSLAPELQFDSFERPCLKEFLHHGLHNFHVAFLREVWHQTGTELV